MKYNPRLIFKSSILLFIAVFSLAEIVEAKTSSPNDSINIPFDGGLTLLLAAGAGYGVKRFRDSRRKNQDKQE